MIYIITILWGDMVNAHLMVNVLSSCAALWQLPLVWYFRGNYATDFFFPSWFGSNISHCLQTPAVNGIQSALLLHVYASPSAEIINELNNKSASSATLYITAVYLLKGQRCSSPQSLSPVWEVHTSLPVGNAGIWEHLVCTRNNLTLFLRRDSFIYLFIFLPRRWLAGCF